MLACARHGLLRIDVPSSTLGCVSSRWGWGTMHHCGHLSWRMECHAFGMISKVGGMESLTSV